METIYDIKLERVVPISVATDEGIRHFLRTTCDDNPIDHNLILECVDELDKRRG